MFRHLALIGTVFLEHILGIVAYCRNCLLFMEPGVLLPCHQRLPFDPIMKRLNSLDSLTSCFSEIKFHIPPLAVALIYELVSSLDIFQLEICIHISSVHPR